MDIKQCKHKELGSISDSIIEIDIKLQNLLTVIEMLEYRAEELKDSKCVDILSLILDYLQHVEAELRTYGNQLDMFWLHFDDCFMDK